MSMTGEPEGVEVVVLGDAVLGGVAIEARERAS